LRLSNLRTDIRSKVVELLDQRNIRHSSVDLVRFSWVEKNDDVEGVDGNEGDEDSKDGEDDDDIENVNIEVAP